MSMPDCSICVAKVCRHLCRVGTPGLLCGHSSPPAADSFSRRACNQEILPTDAFNSVSPRGFFITGRGDDERFECRIAATELQQAPECVDIESTSFHFDRPLSPTPVENRIDLQRLLAPVCHLLPLVKRKCNAGVFDPEAKALRFTSRIWSAIGVCGGKKSIVQDHELRRRGAPSVGLYRVFFERRNQVSVLEQREIMSDRFQSAAILKLSQHFLQGDDLRRRACGNREHLPQQRGTPYRAQREHVAARARRWSCMSDSSAVSGRACGLRFLSTRAITSPRPWLGRSGRLAAPPDTGFPRHPTRHPLPASLILAAAPVVPP